MKAGMRNPRRGEGLLDRPKPLVLGNEDAHCDHLWATGNQSTGPGYGVWRTVQS
jgi:hypothetical protein